MYYGMCDDCKKKPAVHILRKVAEIGGVEKVVREIRFCADCYFGINKDDKDAEKPIFP